MAVTAESSLGRCLFKKPLVRRIWKMGIFLGVLNYIPTAKGHHSLGSLKPPCHSHRTQAKSTRDIPLQNLTFTLFNSSWVEGEESSIMHTGSVKWNLHHSYLDQPVQLAYCSVRDRLWQWCTFVHTCGFTHGLKGSSIPELQHHPALITTIKQEWLQNKAFTNAQAHTNVHTYVYLHCLIMHASFNTGINVFSADGPV